MFINVCQLRNEFMRACVKKEYKYYLFSLFTFAKIPDNNITLQCKFTLISIKSDRILNVIRIDFFLDPQVIMNLSCSDLW